MRDAADAAAEGVETGPAALPEGVARQRVPADEKDDVSDQSCDDVVGSVHILVFRHDLVDADPRFCLVEKPGCVVGVFCHRLLGSGVLDRGLKEESLRSDSPFASVFREK